MKPADIIGISSPRSRSILQGDAGNDDEVVEIEVSIKLRNDFVKLQKDWANARSCSL
ncbi:hypothetical protein OH492_19450 [Vibrio chagasii]|nr:hypothetical protein [Vibrio chagasii]